MYCSVVSRQRQQKTFKAYMLHHTWRVTVVPAAELADLSMLHCAFLSTKVLVRYVITL